MRAQKQNAVVVKDFNKLPVLEEVDVAQPGPGEVLVKVIASTINPSDMITLKGQYWKTQPNFTVGLEGVGEVVKAGDQQGQTLIGKRVSFGTSNGAWAEYSVVNIEMAWQIQNDVPLECGASGAVNPITVIGFVDTFRKWKNGPRSGKGLINSAAASVLGRQLNKYCQRQNIPLLNIVRRQQQVQILQQEGAKFIINTSEQNWVQQYKETIQINGFNILFDAIGGGQVSDKLISNLPAGGHAFIYGKLSIEPLTISKPLIFSPGTGVSNWNMGEWIITISKEERQAIQKNYSSLLKNQLSTKSIKSIKLSEVPQSLQQAQKRSTQGKFTIFIQENK